MDSDQGSSVTKSGINTSNITIRETVRQQDLIGKTAEQIKSEILTDITTDTARENSGALKNNFDKDQVQSEINLQMDVTKKFDANRQEVRTEINKKLDEAKKAKEAGTLSQADFDKKLQQLQTLGILVDSISAGLSAPTSSGLGIAAASYLTNQYKDNAEYQDKNGEFQPNLLPEDVKTQIRDLTTAIGPVVGGTVGDSAFNAQLAGVVGQNAVENNVDSYKDIQDAKANSERMYKDTCAAYGLGEPACGNRIRKEGLEILQGTAMVFVPTSVYEIIPIGKGVGIVVKGTKKIVAVYKDAKSAEKAAEKAKAKIENNVYRDGETSVDWTSAKKSSNNINLAGHWQKHKNEFPELLSQNDYYRFAQDFVMNPPKGTLVKVRKNGDSVIYQPSTNTFAVKTKDGLPRTVFKPDPKEHGYANNLEYFHAQ